MYSILRAIGFCACVAGGGWSLGCGGRTTNHAANDAGGGPPIGADATPHDALVPGHEAATVGARAVDAFESALRAFCKCDNDPDLNCYDWATRFAGESRACYVGFLDRHAAEGLAKCVLDNATNVGNCFTACTTRCDATALTHDSPMAGILYAKCGAPSTYVVETDECYMP